MFRVSKGGVYIVPWEHIQTALTFMLNFLRYFILLEGSLAGTTRTQQQQQRKLIKRANAVISHFYYAYMNLMDYFQRHANNINKIEEK